MLCVPDLTVLPEDVPGFLIESEEGFRKTKKRGGFCRPPRQLYPQEERGIQLEG